MPWHARTKQQRTSSSKLVGHPNPYDWYDNNNNNKKNINNNSRRCWWWWLWCCSAATAKDDDDFDSSLWFVVGFFFFFFAVKRQPQQARDNNNNNNNISRSLKVLTTMMMMMMLILSAAEGEGVVKYITWHLLAPLITHSKWPWHTHTHSRPHIHAHHTRVKFMTRALHAQRGLSSPCTKGARMARAAKGSLCYPLFHTLPFYLSLSLFIKLLIMFALKNSYVTMAAKCVLQIYSCSSSPSSLLPRLVFVL